jgi:hypothetical protein
VAAVVLAVAGTVGALLIPDGRDSPPPGRGHPASGTLTAVSPWRLVVRNKIGGSNDGCTVTVTNTGTGKRKTVKVDTGTESFQVQDGGNLRWEANDSGCLVVQRPGAGRAQLPFTVLENSGDTDAFVAPAQVAVEVANFRGHDQCDFVLRDATDGRALDLGSVQPGAARCTSARTDATWSTSKTRNATYGYPPDSRETGHRLSRPDTPRDRHEELKITASIRTCRRPGVPVSMLHAFAVAVRPWLVSVRVRASGRRRRGAGAVRSRLSELPRGLGAPDHEPRSPSATRSPRCTGVGVKIVIGVQVSASVRAASQ